MPLFLEEDMNQAYRNGQKLLRGAYTQYTPSGKALFVRASAYQKEPIPGAPVYFYSPSLSRIAHVGAVVSVRKEGSRYYIKTAEGNTSSGAGFSRNGGCVAIKEYSFNLNEVGGGNRINGFGIPAFGDDTCTAEEFIKVLLDEVGYVEKASNHNLDIKTANVGTNNYTKYGKWYKDNCGGDHPAYWCQQYISWCAFRACQLHLEKVEHNKWHRQENGWYYKDDTGKDVRGKWLEIAGRWYVFDEAGRAITGWFSSGDEWFYLNPDDCTMVSGQWIDIEGKNYYLTKSGVMARQSYVKANGSRLYYYVDENGLYQPEHDTDKPDLKKYELAN